MSSLLTWDITVVFFYGGFNIVVCINEGAVDQTDVGEMQVIMLAPCSKATTTAV